MEEQSQVRFSSETVYDLDAFQAFQKINTYTHTNWCITRVVVIAAAVYWLFSVYIPSIAFVVLAYCVILLGFEAFRYFRNRDGGLAYKQMLHNYSGNPPKLSCTLTDDAILTSIETESNVKSDRYDSIVRIKETANHLYLVTDLRINLMLSKQTLTGGTREELIAFLRERCPKLKKRIQTGIFGRILNIVFLITLSCTALWSAANLLEIPDKLSGRLTNDYSYQEMAQKLREVDISISEQTILELEEYDIQHELEYGEDYYDTNPYASKVSDLLSWEGDGTYNERTWAWTPSSSGVYWFDTEVWNVSAMYTDFFSGLSAMHPDLDITDVQEDYSGADLDAGRGTVRISFCLDSVPYQMEASYNYDWFDTDILYDVGRILASDGHEEDLYFSFDGQALLLYYGTDTQVRKLERLTGLDFYDTVHMMIGH